jgi:hypothetical protein
MRWVQSGSLLAILALSCCGCSMASVTAIAPAKIGVSVDRYGGMSCAELQTESERILGEAVRPEVPPSQEDEQRKKDLRAEMDTLNQAWTASKC